MTTAQTVLPNKRERLVEAAKLAFYHHGVSTTTLADVAALAAVPLGNVSYSFRTKDDLLAAVIDAHLRELRARFARWDQDIACGRGSRLSARARTSWHVMAARTVASGRK